MASFSKRLNYSFGNEDHETERAALRLRPGDSVVCITGSGDRPLHLLLDDAACVTAVDANKMQSHLLALKMHAMQSLPYEDYVAFLDGSHPHHVEKLKIVSGSLDNEIAHFWLKNRSLIKKGIVFQGALERFFRFVHFPLRMLRGHVIKQLFTFDDLEKQRAFIRDKWDKRWFLKLFEFVVSPPIIKASLGDPGIYYNLGEGATPGKYVYDRIKHCLNHTLARDNYFMYIIFQGGRVPKHAYPPYLNKEGVKAILPKLDRLHIVTADIIEYIESLPEQSTDAFSLSDVAGYLSAEKFARLMRAVHRAAKPGARFSIRQVLTDQKFPEDICKDFQRDSALEHQLEQSDRCMIYRYMVGEIQPAVSCVS